MQEDQSDFEPTVTYRVEWQSRHEDGRVHVNHHDHHDLARAQADLATVESIPHIVSASLTQITVQQKVLKEFSRKGREIGGDGTFTEPDAT